ALVDHPNHMNIKIYLRMTGKADHQRIVKALAKAQGGPGGPAQIKEEKGFRGRKVTFIDHGRPPIMVVVGDEDLLMAGYESPNGGKSADVAREMLEVRRGKVDSVAKGPLADKLKKTSPEAVALFVGTLPESMRMEIQRGPEAFRAIPKEMVAQMLRKG